MLKIGDKVVYPMHGAGIIDDVEDCEVMGDIHQYFVLKLPFGSMKVMIPVDNADNIGLRDVISKDKLKEVKEVLLAPARKAVGSWNKRYHANLERMRSGDILDVAAVTRDLIIQDRVKRISSRERKLLVQAKEILISELIFACDKDAIEMEDWVYAQLQRKESNSPLIPGK